MTLDYIPIETMLERLLEVAPEYGWYASLEGFEHVVEHTENDGDRHAFTAAVSGNLIIAGKNATGFGAMTNSDPDMAIKSANSEAMKNAMKNGWGVGLELWNADHREKLAVQRAVASGDEQALKGLVWEQAKEQLGKPRPTLEEVAGLFGTSPGDLADPEVLKAILKAEGLI